MWGFQKRAREATAPGTSVAIEQAPHAPWHMPDIVLDDYELAQRGLPAPGDGTVRALLDEYEQLVELSMYGGACA